MNKLNTSTSITSSSYRNKKLKKIKNIDTIIFDDECSFQYNYNYKNIKNIIFDYTKIIGNYYIPSSLKYVAYNISFINYPMLDGITIPFEVLKIGKNIIFDFECSRATSNIKKINILYDNYIEEIPIYENITYYEINTIIEENNPKIKIRFLEEFINIDEKNIRNITFDSNGKKEDYYEKFFLDIKNDEELDLRNYSNKKNLYLNEDITKLNKLIVSINTLKNTKLYNFNEIEVKNLEIIDDNEMKLIPKNINLNNVNITIKNSNNIFAILAENIKTKKIKYIYLDNDNRLNVIDEKDKIDSVKYTYSSDTLGMLIKYKGKSNLELIINNKIYIIDKIFINWIMGNYHAIKLKEKLIIKENQDKKNIMELDKNIINDIKEEIFKRKRIY